MFPSDMPHRSSPRFLLGVAAFAVPVLMSIVGAAAVAKLAFPVIVALGALWLSGHDGVRYIQFMVWTFILSPGLRHFVDWYAGFSQTNPIMLAPCIAILASTPTVLLYIINGRRYSVEVLLLILSVLVGVGLALITGVLQDSLLGAMRWLSPVWVAIYICAHAAQISEMRDGVYRTFRLALPCVALYGIAQFVSISSWDAFFMKKAPFTSIGYPLPFAVRVFATMNSPGSLAAMLSTGTLLILPRIRGIGWLTVLLAFLCLAVTTQRAALGAFVISSMLLMLISRDRVLGRNIGKMMLMLALAVAVLVSVPGASKKLTGTVDSVSHLDQDSSAQIRLQQYENVWPFLEGQMIGRGLSWSKNSLYVSVGDGISLDSGLIDIFVSLGIPGGCLFLGALGALLIQGWRISSQDSDPSSRAEFSAVVFGVVQLPFGAQHTGEHGMFMYLALGLLLARCVPAGRDYRSAPQLGEQLSLH